MNQKYYVGQKLKNSPQDDFPYFEIINITTLETTGTVFYRVASLHDAEMQLVLHESDLFPYEEKEAETAKKVVTENNSFIEKLKSKNFKQLCNVAGNILLRPNDTASFMGKERFEALKQAFEIVLQDYKENDLYTYYYNFNREKHGFCTFERWVYWFNKK